MGKVAVNLRAPPSAALQRPPRPSRLPRGLHSCRHPPAQAVGVASEGCVVARGGPVSGRLARQAHREAYR
eukprot:11609444-Alexandrium_andersonii.AAC.1